MRSNFLLSISLRGTIQRGVRSTARSLISHSAGIKASGGVCSWLILFLGSDIGTSVYAITDGWNGPTLGSLFGQMYTIPGILQSRGLFMIIFMSFATCIYGLLVFIVVAVASVFDRFQDDLPDRSAACGDQHPEPLASSHARLSTATGAIRIYLPTYPPTYPLYVKHSGFTIHILTTLSSHVIRCRGRNNTVAVTLRRLLGLACLPACLGSGLNGIVTTIPPYISTLTSFRADVSCVQSAESSSTFTTNHPFHPREHYERRIPFIASSPDGQSTFLFNSQQLRLNRSSKIPVLDTNRQSEYWR